MNCKLCGEPLERVADAYRLVTGWERPGRGIHDKSGSSLVLREATGDFAHATCVVRAQQGLSVNQEALL